MNPFRLRPPKIDIDVKFAPDSAVPTEVLLGYWEVQQARMSAHESSRYNFSNFVVAGSLTVLGFVGTGQMSATGKWVASMVVLGVNLIACSFLLSELRWFKIHQARARAVMATLGPAVKGMEDLADKKFKTVRADDLKTFAFTSTSAVLAIHWLTALGSLVMAVVAPTHSILPK